MADIEARAAADYLRVTGKLAQDPAVHVVIDLLDHIADKEAKESDQHEHLIRKLMKAGYTTLTLVRQQETEEKETVIGIIFNHDGNNSMRDDDLDEARTSSAAVLIAADLGLFLEDSFGQEVIIYPYSESDQYSLVNPATDSEYARLQKEVGLDLTLSATHTDNPSSTWKSYANRAMLDYASSFGSATSEDPYTYQIGD